MKKKYIHAEMEITEFDVDDIITTSDPSAGGDEDGGDGENGDDI